MQKCTNIHILVKSRRQNKIASVLYERGRVVSEQFDIATSCDASSTACSVTSQVLEDITAKEERRIANFVQKQLRWKHYSEKVFLERLEKKEALRAKLEKLNQRATQAESLRERKASELREISETRFQVRDELLAVERAKQISRLEEMKAKQAQQSAQVDQFLKEKEEKHSAATELWEAKLRDVAERVSEKQASQKRKSDQALQQRREKVTKVIERKSRNIRMQQLKAEEGTLRLFDALDRKRQLDRQMAVKREQIGELLKQELEKAHLIELTKEQLLQQRKQVLVSRAKDTVAIDPISTPGPTDYEAPTSSLTELPGGFISVIRPKLDIPGTIDFETSKQVPGPGYYNSSLPEHPILGQWGTSKKTTFVEQDTRRKGDIPGPASYDLPSPRNNSGVAFKRDVVEETASPDILPGPGTYTVDEFTRNEEVRKRFDGGHFYTRRLLLPPIVEVAADPKNDDEQDILEI